MRFALLQPVDSGTDNGSRRVEIRFTNFEVNNMAALPLQFIRPGKGFKCGFTLDSEHAFGNLTFQFSSHNLFKGRQYIIGDVTDLDTQDWVRVASLTEIPTEGIGHAVKAAGLGITGS